MRDEGGATDETLAAPSSSPKLAHGTTRGSDPTVAAPHPPSSPKVGQVTRASSPSLSQPPVAELIQPVGLPVVDRANYQIVGELARGGMGRILEARDLRLDRPIAIKEVLDADEGARARFDREVRITAGLQHPAIVHVTEAGQWENGQPFFAMKLIRGKPLDKRIGEAASLAERLALLPAVIAVTDALAYAHTKSVIHRDLKPANVLVGDFGETVVIDWGIAKDLAVTDEIVSLTPAVRPRSMQLSVHNSGGAETVEGSVMGTPSYMPPEQANGDRVDRRADVYALGAMLYQVLAGVPPFVGRSTAEVLAKVIEGAPAPLATIVPDAPVDLVAVVEKAMARKPADRFPSANEMVAELKRFQQGMLVKSHDYTTWQLTKRWFKRNRGAVLVGAIAVVTLIVAGSLGLWRFLEQKRATQLEATMARAQADAVTIRDAQNALPLDPTEAVAILKRLSPETSMARTARMIASEAAAAGVAHVLAGDGGIAALAFSPDGRSLVAYEAAVRKVKIWDLATWTGRELGSAKNEIKAIAWAAEGIHGFDDKGRIWRWSLATPGAPTLLRALEGELGNAAFSPDGTRLVAEVVDDGPAGVVTRVFDLKTDDRLVCACRHPVWTTDGRAILSHDRKGEGAVMRFEVATGELSTVFTGTYLPVLGGDATNTWVARDSGSFAKGGQQFLRNLRTKRRIDLDVEAVMLQPLPGGGAVISTSKAASVSMSETTRRVKRGDVLPFDPEDMTSGDHSLVVSDGWPGSLTRLVGHTAPVLALAVSSTGVIASGDAKGQIRIWTLPIVARDHDDRSSTFAMLADHDQLVIARFGPRLEIRDLATNTRKLLSITELPTGMAVEKGEGEHIARIGDHLLRDSTEDGTADVVAMQRSADGRHIVTVDTADHAVVWDLNTGRGKLVADQVVHVALNADGTKLATSRKTGEGSRRLLEEWDVATGKSRQLGEMTALSMTYGPRDRLVVSTDISSVFVFETGQQPIHIKASERDAYRALVFSPDGRKLYLGSDNWIISIYNFDDGKMRTLSGHMGTITTLALSPDGSRLFSAAADNTVRVWNTEDGTSTVLRGHKGVVSSIELGENDMLVTASFDGTARIWDLTTGTSRALTGNAERVVFADQLPRSQRIVVVDRAHQVAEYADSLPFDPYLLHGWLDSATNLTK